MEEAVRRVIHMEQLTDQMLAANTRLASAIDHWSATREAFEEVLSYYYSDQWEQDRERSDAGELAAAGSQGVLSEDLIYNVMADNRLLALRLIKEAMRRELDRE